jgi:hypothetical protein
LLYLPPNKRRTELARLLAQQDDKARRYRLGEDRPFFRRPDANTDA